MIVAPSPSAAARDAIEHLAAYGRIDQRPVPALTGRPMDVPERGSGILAGNA